VDLLRPDVFYPTLVAGFTVWALVALPKKELSPLRNSLKQACLFSLAGLGFVVGGLLIALIFGVAPSRIKEVMLFKETMAGSRQFLAFGYLAIALGAVMALKALMFRIGHRDDPKGT